MQIILVFLQEPERQRVSHSVESAPVWAREVPQAYSLVIEIPIGSFARFFDHLDQFISQEMTACRRDGRIIYTAYQASWDPVLKIKNWALEFVGAPVGVTSA